jgi:hypothetical protein
MNLKDVKKRNIRIASKNKNNKAPIRLIGFDKVSNRMWFVDAKKREFIWGSPVPGQQVAVVGFERSEPMTDEKTGQLLGTRWFSEFTCYGDENNNKKIRFHEDDRRNEALIEDNKWNLVKDRALKMHNSVSWRGKNNEKLNENCTEVLYEIIDQEQVAEKEVEDAMALTKALNYINSAWAQGDTKEEKLEFKEIIFGYGLGHYWTNDTENQLYTKLKKKVELNASLFLSFVENPDREMETVINMAIEGKEMSRNGDTYFIGENFPIGTSLSQAKAYLKGETEQYERLKHLYMGKKKDGKTSDSQKGKSKTQEA